MMTTSEDKLKYMSTVYNFLFNNTESFEVDNVGSDMAYLFGAILQDIQVLWPKNRPIVKLLRLKFPPGHRFWGFVEIEGEEKVDLAAEARGD